jgi:hypothetical protein
LRDDDAATLERVGVDDVVTTVPGEEVAQPLEH